MKKNIRILVMTAGFFTMALVGCSKMPQEEIDAALASVDEAKAAGADIYMYESFLEVQDSLNKVIEKIEAKKSKLIINHTESKAELAGIVVYAHNLMEQTLVRKEEVRMEIENMLAETEILMESNRRLITEVPSGKANNPEILNLKNQVDELESALESTTTLMETGEYNAIIDKARAAKEKANSLNSELSRLMDSFKPGVKNKRT